MTYEIARYVLAGVFWILFVIILLLFVGGVVYFFQSRDTSRRFNARYGKK
jgi:cbb3-type cytochrome oxidase subunit 3